jgi:thioredoxin reductase (NADPH)
MKHGTKIIGFDVMIIGGGPAGMSALLWCADLGLKAILLEKANELGGQLRWIHNPITNYPGRIAKNGSELCKHFLRGIEDLKTSRTNSEVVKFDAKTITATLESGNTLSARAAIIATGIRRRKLEVPGEDEFRGRGVIETGSKDRHKLAGKRIAIIGGGDAALENAFLIGAVAKKIYVIHRRDRFNARDEFISRAHKNKKIEFLFNTTLQSIEGDQRVQSVTILKKKNEARSLPIDAVLIRIGVQPNTELFRRQLEVDASGYIIVGSRAETNRKNIFAVGDVASPLSPTIVTAAGMGASAAKAIRALIIHKQVRER